MYWRALYVQIPSRRVWTNERVQVTRLKLVRVLSKEFTVCYTVQASPSCERLPALSVKLCKSGNHDEMTAILILLLLRIT